MPVNMDLSLRGLIPDQPSDPNTDPLPDIPASVTSKPWWTTFAVIVRNTVGVAVAIGVVPAAVSDKTSGVILAAVGVGAFLLNEAVVVGRYIKDSFSNQQATMQFHTARMRLMAMRSPPPAYAQAISVRPGLIAPLAAEVKPGDPVTAEAFNALVKRVNEIG